MNSGTELDKRKKQVRSFEVAELANISRSTVSRALSGDPRISDDTRARVEAAAATLGYQPNLIARGLKNQATGIVGVVVTDLDNAYHAHALQLLIEKLGAKRLAPLVFVGNTAEGAENAIARLMSYQVDAVIALAAPFSSEIVAACRAGKKPLVLMNRYDGPDDVSLVYGDSFRAGAMVADHLIEQGATSFAYFAGDDTTSISSDRERGFTDRISEKGFNIVGRAASRYLHSEALEVAPGLLASGAQAVFCANDTLAFALVDAARMADVPSIPLIAGYDNSALAAWPAYSMTSVDQNLGEMTSVTVDIAQTMVTGEIDKARRVIIEPFLAARSSTLSQARK